MRMPAIPALHISLLSITLLMSLYAACSAADFDEQSIKNANVDDIKKWLKVDAQGHGLSSQWKLLSTRSERLAWWNEVIGYKPLIIRKRRAAWDPTATGGKYIADDSQSAVEKKALFMIVAELPSQYTDATQVGIKFINVEDFQK